MKTQKSLREAKNSLKNDTNLVSTQIGCGYCVNENNCQKHREERRVNHAKAGCTEFKHYTQK